jgi:hypothetical protein
MLLESECIPSQRVTLSTVYYRFKFCCVVDFEPLLTKQLRCHFVIRICYEILRRVSIYKRTIGEEGKSPRVSVSLFLNVASSINGLTPLHVLEL